MGIAEWLPRLGNLVLYYTGRQISSPFPALRPFFKVFRHNLPFIQGKSRSLYLLNGLMSLSRQHDHISRSSLRQRPTDGLPPIGLHMDLSAGASHPGQNILNNGPWILRPGVIRGNHRQVCQLPDHTAHKWPLGSVPVPATAK